MGQINVIEEPEIMNDSLRARRRQRFRRFWPFLAGQIALGVICVVLLCGFHFPVTFLLPGQWIAIIALLYFQLRHADIRGISVPIVGDFFRRWSVIMDGGPSRWAIMVYRIEIAADGNFVCWCWPFRIPRYKLIAFAKVWGIRFAAYIRIIK